MKKYLALIKVNLRDGILDAQGKAIEMSLHSLEFKQFSNVRVGKIISLQIEAGGMEEAERLADSAARKLLANTITEDYFIDLKELI